MLHPVCALPLPFTGPQLPQNNWEGAQHTCLMAHMMRDLVVEKEGPWEWRNEGTEQARRDSFSRKWRACTLWPTAVDAMLSECQQRARVQRTVHTAIVVRW